MFSVNLNQMRELVSELFVAFGTKRGFEDDNDVNYPTSKRRHIINDEYERAKTKLEEKLDFEYTKQREELKFENM